MPTFEDITGQKFNRLTVVARAPNNGRRVMWLCVCDCGGEITTRAYSLKTGHTVSCGCVSDLRLSQHREKHMRSNTRVYRIWMGMKMRCTNPSNPNFHNYGGRGVSVCDEWLSFENFYRDMGDPPDGRSIDRIDPNKSYSKGNCRWATSREQARTKRSNINIEWRGETRVLSDWANHLGVKVDTLYYRVAVYGWDIEKAFTKPVQKRKTHTTSVTR